MFFIVNHENSIIAADTDFLEEIGAKSVYDAALQMQKGKVALDTQTDALLYHQETRSFSKTVLSTFFGEAALYQSITEEDAADQDIHHAKDSAALDIMAAEEILEDTENLPIDKQTQDAPDMRDDIPDLSTYVADEDPKETPPPQEANTSVQTELSEASLQALMDETSPSQSTKNTTIPKESPSEIPDDTHSTSNDEASIELLDLDAIDTDSIPHLDEIGKNEEILDLADLKDELPSQEILATDKTISDSDIFGLADDQETETPPKDILGKVGKIAGLAGAGALAGKVLHDTDESTKKTPLDSDLDHADSFDLTDATKSQKLHIDTPSLSDEVHTLSQDAADAAKIDADAIDISTYAEGEDTVHSDSASSTSEIAALIGVSEEEYILFLDDFRNEVSTQENKLKSVDLRESKEAIASLTEASLLLHLPHVTEKLNALSHATSDERNQLVDDLLVLVSKTGASSTEEVPATGADDTVPEIEAFSPIKETEESDQPTEHKEEIKTEFDIPTDSISDKIEEDPEIEIASTSSQASLSLEEVKSVPFDFSINAAADELTLPASLVEEFVVDFIDQAKENLPVLQKAYEEENLEMVQTTAHMLKGASSNLRIVPMADTLYKLQFNENIAQVPELLTLFAGQLKALSVQMGHA